MPINTFTRRGRSYICIYILMYNDLHAVSMNILVIQLRIKVWETVLYVLAHTRGNSWCCKQDGNAISNNRGIKKKRQHALQTTHAEFLTMRPVPNKHKSNNIRYTCFEFIGEVLQNDTLFIGRRNLHICVLNHIDMYVYGYIVFSITIYSTCVIFGYIWRYITTYEFGVRCFVLYTHIIQGCFTRYITVLVPLNYGRSRLYKSAV